jgi:hypothetical protein
MRVAPLLAATALLATGTALAGPKAHPDHKAAISISPIHLVFPVVEIQAEFYISSQLSASVIGGYGSITAEATSIGQTTEYKFSVFELGAQLRGYLYGTSHEGAFAAFEVLYVGIDGETGNVTGQGDGTSLGALLGYKWVWDAGFLIDLAAGVQRAEVTATASDGSQSATETEAQIGPALNFNLGWAF